MSLSKAPTAEHEALTLSPAPIRTPFHVAPSMIAKTTEESPSRLVRHTAARLHRPHIVNGSNDQGDPAVLELWYAVPGGIATCSGELLGPHTVMTAGHCTDTTAGGELSGSGGPALTICTASADVQSMFNGQTPSSGCNLAVLALFDNKCTTNDTNFTCESGLVSAGNDLIVTELTNPGYDGSVSAPSNDNDIGLAKLGSGTPAAGLPSVLIFNRTSEGSQCTDLGTLKFVGYGITSANGQTSGVKNEVTNDVRVLDSYHNYEGDPTYLYSGGVCTTQVATNGGGPTCSGDSGGPSMNTTTGLIMGITSLGDQNCEYFSQDTRVDVHASWIDSTMTGWGDPVNGGGSSSTTGTSAGTTTGTSAGTTTGTTGTNGTDECESCPSGTCSGGGTCYATLPDGGADFCFDPCSSSGTCGTNETCDSTYMICLPTSNSCSGFSTGGTTTGGSGTTGTTATSAGTTGTNGTDECESCPSGTCSGGGTCYATVPDGGGDFCFDPCSSSGTCGTNETCDSTYMVCLPTSNSCSGFSTGGTTTGGSGTTGTTATSAGTTGTNGTDECESCPSGTCSGGGTCYATVPDGGGDFCFDPCSSSGTCGTNETCNSTYMICLPTSNSCSGFSTGGTTTTGGSVGTTGPTAATVAAASSGATGHTSGIGGIGAAAGTTATAAAGSTAAAAAASTTGGAGATVATAAAGSNTGAGAGAGNNTGGIGAGAGTTGGPTGGFGGPITGASAGATTGTAAAGAGSTGSTGTTGVHLNTTFGAAASTGSTGSAPSGGCSSAGFGDLTPAMFALLGLLRRRRRA